MYDRFGVPIHFWFSQGVENMNVSVGLDHRRLSGVWKGEGHLKHQLVLGDSLDRLQQVCIQRELMIQPLLAFLSQTISQKVNVMFTKTKNS